MTPTAPPGAKMYYADADWHPCKPSKAVWWTYEGGPQWYKTASGSGPVARTLRDGDSARSAANSGEAGLSPQHEAE